MDWAQDSIKRNGVLMEVKLAPKLYISGVNYKDDKVHSVNLLRTCGAKVEFLPRDLEDIKTDHGSQCKLEPFLSTVIPLKRWRSCPYQFPRHAET